MAMLELFRTSYGMVLLAGWVAACALGVWSFRREKLPMLTWALTAVLGLVLGALGARCYYIFTHDVLGYGFYGSFLRAEPYYHAFCGAVLGVMLAAVLAGLAARVKIARVMEALTLPGLLMIAVARFAETLSDFGWGQIIETEWMLRFPMGVQDPMWQEWHFAVFNLEGLCALVIGAVLLLDGRRGGKHRLKGLQFPTALVWWAMTQVFCESFRVETIKWGFVRVQQVQCAVFAAAVLLVYTVKRCRAVPKRYAVTSWVTFVACVGVVVFLEFAIDKCPWPTWVNYVAMVLTLGAMGWSVQRMLPMGQRTKEGASA